MRQRPVHILSALPLLRAPTPFRLIENGAGEEAEVVDRAWNVNGACQVDGLACGERVDASCRWAGRGTRRR